MSKITVAILTGSAVISLSGCVAAPLVLTGVGVASVAVNETTGKTTTDHIVSALNGKDCRVSRAGKEEVCQDDYGVQIKITTTGVTPSSTQEIESRYR
jgi:hypothetical protein